MGGTGTLDYTTFSLSSLTVTGNTILTGNGTNTVFGNMRDFIQLHQGGVENGENTLTFFFPLSGAQFIFSEIYGGYNTITVGNGLNTIYGNMRDISFTEIGGSGINILPESTDVIQNGTFGNFISMGHNDITAGTGVNIINGDFRNFTVSVSGGTNPVTLVTFTAGGAVYADNFIDMGFNIIDAGLSGSSTNTISGNGENFELSLTAGTASLGLCAENSILRNFFALGNNQITTGDGSSTIYGDIQHISWSAAGGSADGDGSNAIAVFRNNTLLIGGQYGSSR